MFVSILVSIAGVGTLATDVQPERALDTDIVVTAGRTPTYRTEVVQVGAFRNQSILDTPLTIAVIPRALLDAQGAQGLEDALRNTPGVTQQSTSPVTSNNFVSRGVLMNARTNYRLNGSLPIVNLGPIPIENKQRVELLKGVSALYYGVSTPSGIVNVVTKRAGPQPVTTVLIGGDIEGGRGGGIDIGRQFGADDRFGIRINGYAARLETPIDGVDGHRYVASGAFDWRMTDRLSVKLDLEHYRRETDEPGGITRPAVVGGILTLPAVPDPHHRYAPAGAPYLTTVTNALARADYALADDWSLRAEAGVARTRRERVISNLGTYNLLTGVGRLTTTRTRDQAYVNHNLRVELTGKVATGPIRHDLLIGYTRNRQVQDGQNQQSFAAVAQNLYDPVSIPFASLRPTTTRFIPGTTNIDTGLYVLDVAHLGARWLAIGGVRHVDYWTRETSGTSRIRTWTPTVGLVFRPGESSSLYATYIEGLESAGTAPDGTANAGDVLAPVTSRQIELGGRVQLSGALLSVAWFTIDRGLSYADAANIQVVDGKAVHRGVEASLQGRLGPAVSIAIGGQYLDAVQRATGVAAQNGRQVENTPKYAGSVFAEYRPPALPALGLNAGVYYTGRRAADLQERAWLPDYATLSLGLNYRIALDRGTMTLRVNADNVSNTRYWATGGTTLYAGLARTVRASAAIDF